ncbi:dihydrodipicolinate synthase family protein [Streptomyces malaysiensis]|uniref:dihydrodipicolinate synthase family protein n=1 Tax=Streptomyces malaysiensis TaxID=92644 RepID=UPI0027E47580|nr:dihydrodipicolinate synthase family protein [Streptomyces samsunensis]
MFTRHRRAASFPSASHNASWTAPSSLLVSIHRALRDGDLDRARAEWARIYPLMDAIMAAPFIPAVKAALTAAGFPVGEPRAPLLGLDAATTARISALVEEVPRLSAAR